MTTTTIEVLARLQAALDGLASALTTGRADAVLSAEEPLAAAVSDLAGLEPDTPADRDRLRRAITHVALTVLRCRALGQSATDLARAVAPPPGYGRSGAPLVPFSTAARGPRS